MNMLRKKLAETVELRVFTREQTEAIADDGRVSRGRGAGRVRAGAARADAGGVVRTERASKRAQSTYELDRPVLIHVCKDGTISYRTRAEPVFNGRALPVFSVDTEEQARAVQVRFGRRQYGEHPDLPGRPWYRWTDFDGDVEKLDDVSRAICEF